MMVGGGWDDLCMRGEPPGEPPITGSKGAGNSGEREEQSEGGTVRKKREWNPLNEG